MGAHTWRQFSRPHSRDVNEPTSLFSGRASSDVDRVLSNVPISQKGTLPGQRCTSPRMQLKSRTQGRTPPPPPSISQSGFLPGLPSPASRPGPASWRDPSVFPVIQEAAPSDTTISGRPGELGRGDAAPAFGSRCAHPWPVREPGYRPGGAHVEGWNLNRSAGRTLTCPHPF